MLYRYKKEVCAISIQIAAKLHIMHINTSSLAQLTNEYEDLLLMHGSANSNTYFEVKKTILIDDPCTNPSYYKKA